MCEIYQESDTWLQRRSRLKKVTTDIEIGGSIIPELCMLFNFKMVNIIVLEMYQYISMKLFAIGIYILESPCTFNALIISNFHDVYFE